MWKATDPNSPIRKSPGRDGNEPDARRALRSRIAAISAEQLKRWRDAEFEVTDESDDNEMVSDDDLILLESYLDDELSDAEQASLRNRLTGDPALAAALADVKAERATRQAVWAAMEPSDAEMRSLAAAVQHSTRRREAWAGRARRFGQVAVAAACVVVGLAVGWQSRPAAPPGSGPEVPFVAREMMVDVNENASFAHGREAGVVDADEENRQIQFVGRVLPVRTEPQTVVMTDSRGRVVAVNQFATPDEAREFLADVAHRGFVPHPPASQGAPVRPPVPADRNVVPVSADRF